MNDMITQLGAVGVLGAAFLLIVRWMLNNFTNQQEKTITSLDKLSGHVHGGFDKSNALITYLISQVADHDLTVHGVNPSTGANRDESAKEAVRIHEAWKERLDNLITILNQ